MSSERQCSGQFGPRRTEEGKTVAVPSPSVFSPESASRTTLNLNDALYFRVFPIRCPFCLLGKIPTSASLLLVVEGHEYSPPRATSIPHPGSRVSSPQGHEYCPPFRRATARSMTGPSAEAASSGPTARGSSRAQAPPFGRVMTEAPGWWLAAEGR